MDKILAFFILPLCFLQNGEYHQYEIEYLSINEISGDTVINVNYFLDFSKNNTLDSNFEIKISDVNSINQNSNKMIFDLENQWIKLKNVDGNISVTNVDELKFPEPSLHDNYFKYLNCGSTDLLSNLINFVNHDLSFLKILTASNPNDQHKEFSRNGYSLRYQKVAPDTNKLFFKLDDISLENYCYNFYDCKLDREDTLINQKIQEGEKNYHKLSPENKRRVSKADFNNGMKVSAKRESDRRISIHKTNLDSCLNKVNDYKLVIELTKDQTDINEITITRDEVIFPHIFYQDKLEINSIIRINRL